jgi:serine/threonine protein kinase
MAHYTEEKYKIHFKLILPVQKFSGEEKMRDLSGSSSPDPSRVFYKSTYDGKQVIVKVLVGVTLESNPHLWTQCFNELHCQEQLRHHCILPVVGLRFYHMKELRRFCPGIVTPYKTRGSLHSVLEEGPALEWKQHIWIRGITEALHYIHTAQILHRDIKPMNVFIENDKWLTPLLSDFGIAVPLVGDSLPGRAHVGTPGFRAPEVESGEAYGYPSDIWSFGATAYCIIRGTTSPPNHLSGPIGRSDLELLISRCLDRDPSRRPTSLELRDEIRRLTPRVGDFAEHCTPISDAERPRDVFAEQNVDSPWLNNGNALKDALLCTLGFKDPRALSDETRSLLPQNDESVDWHAVVGLLAMYFTKSGCARALAADLPLPQVHGCSRNNVEPLQAAHAVLKRIEMEPNEKFLTFVFHCPKRK